MDKKSKRIFRKEDLRFINKCPVCGKEKHITIGSFLIGYTDCICGAVTVPTGKISVVGTPIEVLRDLWFQANQHVQHNLSDWYVDERTLETHSGRFLWAYRNTGTSLLLLDLPGSKHESAGDSLFGALGNTNFFYYGSYLREVSKEEAKTIWRSECN